MRIAMITKYIYQSGQLWLHLTGDYDIGEFLLLEVDGLSVPFRVLDYKERGEVTLLRLRGIDNEKQAARLIGASPVQSVAPDEQFVEGFRILGPDGKDYGLITEIDDTTLNILAHLDSGAMVPLHDELIDLIDYNAQEIHYRVTPPLVF